MIETETVLLAAAASADLLAAAIGLSAAGIRLPLRSSLAAAAVGAAVLSLSVSAAALISAVFPIGSALLAARILLALTGGSAIFGSIRKKRPQSVRGGMLHSCNELMSDPACADCDRSRSISVLEAAAMSLALSADSAAAGIAAGMSGANAAAAFILSFAAGSAACVGGSLAGRAIRCRISAVPSGVIGGAILIIIALAMI